MFMLAVIILFVSTIALQNNEMMVMEQEENN